MTRSAAATVRWPLWGQYRADQQDLGFQPGRAAKQRGEGMEYG